MTALFYLRAAQADRAGYYYTRWDQATPIEVVAETKQAAINAAAAILGEARRDRYWTFKTDRIAPAPPACQCASRDGSAP